MSSPRRSVMAKSGTVVKEKEQKKKRKIDELRSAPLHKDVVFFFFCSRKEAAAAARAEQKGTVRNTRIHRIDQRKKAAIPLYS